MIARPSYQNLKNMRRVKQTSSARAENARQVLREFGGSSQLFLLPWAIHCFYFVFCPRRSHNVTQEILLCSVGCARRIDPAASCDGPLGWVESLCPTTLPLSARINRFGTDLRPLCLLPWLAGCSFLKVLLLQRWSDPGLAFGFMSRRVHAPVQLLEYVYY